MAHIILFSKKWKQLFWNEGALLRMLRGLVLRGKEFDK
jgi:hypothetical protein